MSNSQRAVPAEPGSEERHGTAILLAGSIAFVSLIVYLAFAFGSERAGGSTPRPASVSSEPAQQPQHDAPGGAAGSPAGLWQPVGARLSSARLGRGLGLELRVAAASPPTTPWFGAQIPTIVVNPSPGRVSVSLWLKAPRRTRIGVQVSAFRAGTPNRRLIQKSVGVAPAWRHVTFAGRVRGRWTGLGLFVYQPDNVAIGSSFAIRGVTVRADGVAGS
ncbi:MAG: hypothetical protein ACRDL7_00910 [Gaiellaceae bacterium]